ncbi:MAG TPA: M23 family metallopeptidase [Devosiaceae bacterium]
MSIRVDSKALRGAASAVSIVWAATMLSGCMTLGFGGDPTVTSSTATSSAGNLNQPMPGPVVATVAPNGRFIPPAEVGQPSGSETIVTGSLPANRAKPNSVTSQDLPALASSSAAGSPAAMPAQPSSTPVQVASVSQSPAPAAVAPKLAAVPDNSYVHVIEAGESIYSIARRYDVATDAIVKANHLSAPNQIFVGQKLIIPGRGDLVANRSVAAAKPASPTAVDKTETASIPPVAPAAKVRPIVAATAPAQSAAAAPASAPAAKVANIPQTPATPASGSDKFRWPLVGRVINDFASTKGTGINIEAPEGAMVRAVDSGTVIYVGNAVEGYGNLVLIKHPNGYVSAYAHLKDISVSKGEDVMRGDPIGSAGMTGSVSRPQLHFELRKGATPVDPLPLLATSQG